MSKSSKSAFGKGKIVAFKYQELSEKVIAKTKKKKEKISRCNIEFSFIRRRLWNNGMSTTSAKAAQKDKKGHYKDLRNRKKTLSELARDSMIVISKVLFQE